jgi:uncharacterized protein YoxC
MPPWEIAVVVCLAVVTAVLVALLLALRRVALRVEGLLGILEADVGPLVGRVNGLLDEVHAIAAGARHEMERVDVIVAHAQDVAQSVGWVVGAVAGLTRAGQLVTLALAARRGLNVFVHRYRGEQGDQHA